MNSNTSLYTHPTHPTFSPKVDEARKRAWYAFTPEMDLEARYNVSGACPSAHLLVDGAKMYLK